MAVVWFLTGFWHGASWNFILWGLFFFVLLILEKAFLLSLFGQNSITKVLGHIWTLLLVGMSWMLFDHASVAEGFGVIASLFGVGVGGLVSPAVGYELCKALPLLLVGVLASTPYPAKGWRWLCGKHPTLVSLQPLLVLLLFLLSVATMVSGTYSPFLYFNF